MKNVLAILGGIFLLVLTMFSGLFRFSLVIGAFILLFIKRKK